jgi:hypothetical protein
MEEHVLTRHSYEAEVVLVPLDRRAAAALDGPSAAALAEITIVAPSPDGAHEQAVRHADMVIVLSYDLSAVDQQVVTGLAEAARAAGAPLGSVIIAPERRWTDPDSERGALTLREASDTVVVLGDLAPAVAFLRVLRGGSSISASPAGV